MKFKVGDKVTSENRGTSIVKAIYKTGYLFMVLDKGKEIGSYKISSNVAHVHFYLLIPSKLEKAML